MRAGHADVREVGRAARQDALVGGLHVRVRADHRGDASVEKPAHRELLGRGFGVKVHEHDRRAGRANARELLVDGDERVVERRHEDAAHHVDDADRDAVAFPDVRAGTGRAGRIVRRSDEPRLAVDEVHHLALVPDVIARRHHVDAGAEQFVADLARNTGAAGGVFAVGQDQVDVVGAHESGQAALHQLPARPGHDVADEQQLHP